MSEIENNEIKVDFEKTRFNNVPSLMILHLKEPLTLPAYEFINNETDVDDFKIFIIDNKNEFKEDDFLGIINSINFYKYCYQNIERLIGFDKDSITFDINMKTWEVDIRIKDGLIKCPEVDLPDILLENYLKSKET